MRGRPGRAAGRELRDALRAAVPEDGEARERARRVVLAAYAEQEPVRRRLSWPGAVVALVLSAMAVAGAAAASAPDSSVGRWVREVFSEPAPRKATPGLGRLPGGGRLLVQSGSSAWVVAGDGAKRRLGRYSGASWSPHGRFVIAWHGRELTALEPGGAVRWSLSAPAPVSAARWGPVDGYRIAYVAGGELRIVNGDGTGDRLHGGVARGVAPAWRPDDGHVLAFADARSRIEVVAVDTRRRLWRSARLGPITSLAWSADGRRLLAGTGGRLHLFSRAGRPLRSRATAGTTITHVMPEPRGRAFVVVRHDAAADTGEVVLVGPRLDERRLFSAPGRVGAPARAPDSGALLVPWPATDQWVFLERGGSRRPAAVGRVARQFAPGARHAPSPVVAGWCCPPS